MAYVQDEKGTGLDALTTPDSADLVIMSDVSDSGRAKKTTFAQFGAAITTIINAITGSNKVNATATDTTAGVLDDKIEITSDDSSVTIAKNVSSGNEKITYDLSVLAAGGGGGGTKLAIDVTPFTHTGNTTETTAYTVSIPGGILGTNNAIRFTLPGHDAGNGDTVTYRFKYGGSTFTTVVDGTGAAADVEILGMMLANGSLTSQIGYSRIVIDSQESAADDGTSAITKNSAIDQDLLVTVQLGSASGSVALKGIIVEQITSASGVVQTYFTRSVVPPSGGTNGEETLDTNTRMFVSLMNIPQQITISDISVYINTFTAAGTITIALFSEDGQTRYINATTASLGSTGMKTVAITPVTLPAGNYYQGVHSNGTTNVGVIYGIISGNNETPTGGAVTTGRTTITASTTPTTINPVSDITFNQSANLLLRYDA